MLGLIPKIIALLLTIVTAISSILSLSCEKKVQNVILLIGDGMGEMHLDMTEEMRDVSLAINTMPQKGYSITYSANKSVTDTAANVPVRAYGTYDFIEDGEIIENIMIPVRIADALGFPEDSIPFEVECVSASE